MADGEPPEDRPRHRCTRHRCGLGSAEPPQRIGRRGYFYDGDGRRVRKDGPAGESTVYHYDPAGRLISETLPDGTKLRDYIYLGNKLLAVDGCISTSPPACTERQWYHDDTLGSVLARTDATGSVVARFEYQAWGERWTSTGTNGDRQYKGRVFDPGTGFHDYGARMYWPEIGRFVSADPAGIHPQWPQSWNRYAYVWNNPYKFTDPTGKDVTITIQRDTYTANSVTGTISVTSNVPGAGSFTGYTLETTHGGPAGNRDPIAPGSYEAFVRTDHTPNRVELENVPGRDNIQLHVGNTATDVTGCFAVGTQRQPNTVQNSNAAMQAILAVVNGDGTGNVTVQVAGPPAPQPGQPPAGQPPAQTPPAQQPVQQPPQP